MVTEGAKEALSLRRIGCGRYLGKGAAVSGGEYLAKTSDEETVPLVGGLWRPMVAGGVELRRPTGGMAFEGRLQDEADSDLEGATLGLGVGGTFGPPKETPPEMTTVVDAVFGGAIGIGVAGICCSPSLPILKVGAFGLRPVEGGPLLPNFPPSAAVIGPFPISTSSSNPKWSWRAGPGGFDGRLNVDWAGPAVDGMRGPALGTRGTDCL